MSETVSKFDEILQSIGYVRQNSQSDVIWWHQLRDPSLALSHDIELLVRKETLSLVKCSVVIDLDVFKTNLKKNAKNTFGNQLLSCDVQTVGEATQLILAVGPAQKSKKKSESRMDGKGTVIGVAICFDVNRDRISMQFSDSFIMGDYRQDWWRELVELTFKSLTKHGYSWDLKHFREYSLKTIFAPLETLTKSKKGIRSFLEAVSTTDFNVAVPVPLQMQVFGDEICFELKNSGADFQSQPRIETIQARETARTWQRFDRELSLGVAPKQGADSTVSTIDDIYARFAAYHRLGVDFVKNNSKNPDHKIYCKSFLSRSGLVKYLDETSDREELVYHLSDLVRDVGDSFSGFKADEVVSRIVSETLGDVWCLSDFEMAKKCWLSALSSGGNKSRLLHKLAKLENESENCEGEFEYQCSLSKTESRKDLLKTVSARMIELYTKDVFDKETYRDMFIDSLKHVLDKLPNQGDPIIALAQCYIDSGEHRKAMHLLECSLSQDFFGVNDPVYAKMNAMLAQIWHQNEGNSELATVRYVMATKAPAMPPPDVLNAAECYFLETSNFEQVQRILQVRVDSSDLDEKIDALESGAKYFDDQKKISESTDQVLKLLDLGKVQMWYLDILAHASESDQQNFESIVTAFVNASLEDLTPAFVNQWNLTTFRYAWKYPNLFKTVMARVCEPEIAGHLSIDESKLAVDFLRNSHDKRKLSAFIEARLAAASRLEMEVLVHCIIDDQIFSETGIIDDAIARYVNFSADERVATSRFADYLKLNDVNAMISFIDLVLEKVTDKPAKFNILSHMRDSLFRSSNEIEPDLREGRLEGVFAYIYSQQSQLKEFSNAEIRKLTQECLQLNFDELALTIFEFYLERNLVVVDDPVIVGRLCMNHSNLLSKWHYLMGKTASSMELAVNHYLAAFEMWSCIDVIPNYIFESCNILAKSGRLNLDKFELLEAVCHKQKVSSQFIEVLEAVVTHTEDEKNQGIVHRILRICNAVNDDYFRSANIYRLWVGTKKAKSMEDLYSLGILFLKGNATTTAQDYFLSFLSSPEVLKLDSLLIPAIEMLHTTELDRTRFATVIHTLISWAKASDQKDIVDKLISYSIKLNVAEYDDLARAFVVNFESESPDALAHIAAQALSKVERHTNGVLKALNDWRQSSQAEANPRKWWDIVKLMTRDKNLGQLRKASRIEILCTYALYLFEQENLRFDSLAIFEMIAFENPMDSRAWIPLYSLYEECSAHGNLVNHLERIIPMLERDKTPLEKTPFNLESLKNSLKRAKSKVASTGGGINQQFGKSNRSLDQQILGAKSRVIQRANQIVSPIVAINPFAANEVGNESGTEEQLANDSQNELVQSDAGEGHIDGSAALNLNFDLSQLLTPQNIDSSKNNSFNALSIVNSDVKLNHQQPELLLSSTNSLVHWRKLLESESDLIGITDRILTMAFASEVEKHIAVQVASVLAGEIKALDNWHWQVWRKANNFEYPTNGSARMPENEGFKEYGGSLHKLLKLVYPVLIRVNRSKFQFESKVKKQGGAKNLMPKLLDMDHPALRRTGLLQFAPLLYGLKVKFADSPQLGLEVFFDLPARTIYFDARWHLESPPSILMHRVLEHLVSLQKGYLGLVDLDPAREIIPVINEIKEVLSSTGVEKLRIAFGMRHRDIFEQLKRIDREQLIALLTTEGAPKLGHIIQLQHEMKLKTYSTILASTLDLVGMLESLTGRNLCENFVLGQRKILELHSSAVHLINIATKLKL